MLIAVTICVIIPTQSTKIFIILVAVTTPKIPEEIVRPDTISVQMRLKQL